MAAKKKPTKIINDYMNTRVQLFASLTKLNQEKETTV